MKKLEQFLAKKDEPLSWVQINLPYLLSKEIQQWSQDNIPEDQLSAKGKEEETHVTVFYGFYDNTPFKVRKIIEKIKPFKIELGKISVFHNEEFDVLKITVYSDELKETNEKLKSIPHKESKYSFNPHVTLAYLKKDGNWKFGSEDHFIGIKFKVDEMVFTAKDKKKFKIELNP